MAAVIKYCKLKMEELLFSSERQNTWSIIDYEMITTM